MWQRNYPPWFRDFQGSLKNFLRKCQQSNQISIGFWWNFRLAAVLNFTENPAGSIEVCVFAKRGVPARELANVIYSTGYLLFEEGHAQELYTWVARVNRPAKQLGLTCGLVFDGQTRELEGETLQRLSMNRGRYEDYHQHKRGRIG